MDKRGFGCQTLKLSDGEIFLTEIGDKEAPVVLFLHGWPQNWEAWRDVMLQAGRTHRAVAIDLPGIGKSVWPSAPGHKRAIAAIIHEVIQRLNLQQVTLVGHDAGGQIVYAYLTQFDGELKYAAIVDVVIPGVAPWEDVLRNPYIWHFAFHAIPELPEMLVQGRQAAYFDYFFNATSARPGAIKSQPRQAYAEAYGARAALVTGFDWYRAFPQDARDNQAFRESGGSIATPLLYVRGAKTHADISVYKAGLQASGVRTITTALIEDSGHFAAEEQPDRLWAAIAQFIQT
jgi:pimeloyl-ACP methyl ester carboxylesterase